MVEKYIPKGVNGSQIEGKSPHGNGGIRIHDNDIWSVAIVKQGEVVDWGIAVMQLLPRRRIGVLLNGEHLYEFPRRPLQRHGQCNMLRLVERLEQGRRI